MKQTTKTSRVSGFFEKMFRELNKTYFNDEIEEPIITLTDTKDAYGHCTVFKVWSNNKGETQRELNISSNYMNRPIEEVAATMVHEMVHLWNLQNGIQDCSRGGSYHNKKFRDRAEATGAIHIEHHNKYGWTITTPTEKLLEFCIEHDFTEVNIVRGGNWSFTKGKDKGKDGTDTNTGDQKKKPKGNSRKYICPICKITVRATRDLTAHLKCAICDTILIEED